MAPDIGLMAPGREKVCHRSDIVLSDATGPCQAEKKVHYPGD